MSEVWSFIKDFLASIVLNMAESKFVRITIDIIREFIYELLDVIGNNLKNMVFILRATLPYIMLFLGVYLYKERGRFAVGGEFFIPIIVFVVTNYMRQYANRLGKGERIPIPDKRFTEPGEEDGEYSVETNRLQEMIIYMSNLEDWLQRKGLLKK